MKKKPFKIAKKSKTKKTTAMSGCGKTFDNDCGISAKFG